MEYASCLAIDLINSTVSMWNAFRTSLLDGVQRRLTLEQAFYLRMRIAEKRHCPEMCMLGFDAFIFISVEDNWSYLMKTVILCGGKGTRLREETEYRPKPMVHVGNKPVLWHIMKTYAHFGYNEFIICLGYKGTMIKEYFLNYEAMNNDFTIALGNKDSIQFHNNHLEKDWVVTLADTGENAQTGARVKKVERYITEDTFMLTYGDGVGQY